MSAKNPKRIICIPVVINTPLSNVRGMCPILPYDKRLYSKYNPIIKPDIKKIRPKLTKNFNGS